MMYVILSLGILCIAASLLLQKKRPKAGMVLQLVTLALFIAAIVLYYLETPHYNAFIQAMQGQFAS